MELVDYSFTVQRKDKKSINIMPLGDIQWTGDKHDVATSILQKRIQYGLDHDCWFVGMGDYIDYASPSNRAALKSAKLYDNARRIHDNSARALVDEVYDKFLAPTKDRWLGLLEGHHFTELDTGITSDQYLCEKLRTKFLGTSAYLGLHFVIRGPGSKHKFAGNTGTVNIWCHHGAGSGTTSAGQIPKLDKIFADWEADIFLMGHMTKHPVAPVNRIYPVWPRAGSKGLPKLHHSTKFLIGTGGFGKGYIEQSMQGNTPRGTYVEAGMMRPASLGCPMIRIYPEMCDFVRGDQRIAYFKPRIIVETEG